MQVLRTPDQCFDDLPDYAFEPQYPTVDTAGQGALRVHYVDEGPRDAAPVLLMHGEPSWSYLYRKFIPALAAKGHRVLAPDLIGFGRSDKPVDRADYTYERHVDWMRQWLVALDLTDITLFCQDWGGLIGLRLVAAFPDRFARLVIGNTALPTGGFLSPGFDQWLAYSQGAENFAVGAIVDRGCIRSLRSEEIAAYDAPFPDDSYTAGARQFPALVPITSSHPSVPENIAAWTILETFDRPVLTCFSDSDPVTKGGHQEIERRIPGAAGQPHVIIENAGHFLQEDKPEALSELIDRFIARTSVR